MIGVKTFGRVGRVLAFVLAIGGQTSFGASQEAAPAEEFSPSPDAITAVEIGAVEARTGALLLSGQAGGDVEGALIWSLEERRENGRVDLPFVIEVEGDRLLSGDSGRAITIGFYAYVVDGSGRIVDHIAQGVVLDPAAVGQQIAATGLKFIGHFELLPGEYALRVMVRNQANDNFFMSWGLLTVPAAADATTLLLPPLLPDRSADWLIVRQAGEDLEIDPGERLIPLPAARPTLVEDRGGVIWLGGGGWGNDSGLVSASSTDWVALCLSRWSKLMALRLESSAIAERLFRRWTSRQATTPSL